MAAGTWCLGEGRGDARSTERGARMRARAGKQARACRDAIECRRAVLMVVVVAAATVWS
jgi:hypothetical protein